MKSRTQKWLKSEGEQLVTFCSNWSVHTAWRSGECRFTGGVCVLDLSSLLTSCLLWPSTTLWCPKKTDNYTQDSLRHHLLKFLPGIKSGLMTLNLSPDKKTSRLPGNAKVNTSSSRYQSSPLTPCLLSSNLSVLGTHLSAQIHPELPWLSCYPFLNPRSPLWLSLCSSLSLAPAGQRVWPGWSLAIRKPCKYSSTHHTKLNPHSWS